MGQLINKHPDAQEAKLGSLLFGQVDYVPDVIFQQINGEMNREAATTWNLFVSYNKETKYHSLFSFFFFFFFISKSFIITRKPAFSHFAEHEKSHLT